MKSSRFSWVIESSQNCNYRNYRPQVWFLKSSLINNLFKGFCFCVFILCMPRFLPYQHFSQRFSPPTPPPPYCGFALLVATPYLHSSILSVQREVLSVHGILNPIFLHPVGLVERRALSSDSANVVPSWKLHLKKILLVLFPQGVWTPNPVIIVKATRLRSEGVERFLPRRRIDVVIRDLSVLHTDWITAAREVWNKMRIGTYDIQKNALYTI